MTVWHYGFFGGIILLNVMVLFRSAAMQMGGWPRVAWTGVVLAIGGGLLYCIYRMRLHRLAREAEVSQLPAQVSAQEAPSRRSGQSGSRGRRPAKKKKRR